MQVLLLAVITVFAPAVWCYDEAYDKIDMDKIINDDALFSSYIDCFMDKGPCTMEYAEDFKKLLPEVISTACANCNQTQKKNVRMTVNALQSKKPDAFTQFIEKYDTKGEHKEEFIKFMAATD